MTQSEEFDAVVKALLDAGANVKALNASGQSCIHIGVVEVVSLRRYACPSSSSSFVLFCDGFA
jgi:hypothetical protein